MIRRLAVFLAPLLLAGCLVSDSDLIAPADADYPIADGTRFAEYPLDETGARAGDDPESVIVTRDGARYLMQTGEDGKLFSGLMKEIGPELYAVMMREDDVAEGNLYALMKREGALWKRWGMVCPDFVSLTEANGRTLADFGIEVRNSDCVAKDFSSITKALLFAHEHQAPDAEYVAE